MKPIIVEDKDGKGVFLVEFSRCLGLSNHDADSYIAIPYDAVIYEYDDDLGAAEKLSETCCIRYHPMRVEDRDEWLFDTFEQVKGMITREALKTKPRVYADELPW